MILRHTNAGTKNLSTSTATPPPASSCRKTGAGEPVPDTNHQQRQEKEHQIISNSSTKLTYRFQNVGRHTRRLKISGVLTNSILFQNSVWTRLRRKINKLSHFFRKDLPGGPHIWNRWNSKTQKKNKQRTNQLHPAQTTLRPQKPYQ
jgi:hypothetical protein